jgi:outer membrane protein assembly factor BamB
MKISRNKATATAIAVFMMVAMVGALLPSASAWNDATQAAVDAGMKWDFPGAENYDASATRLLLWERYGDHIPTYVYEVISPNPVGVGQDTSVIMFNPQVLHGAQYNNDLADAYEYTLELEKPSGEKVTLPSDGSTYKSDSTGSTFAHFIPDEVGNWTLTVTFHEMFYKWYDSSTFRDFYGVTFEPSTYSHTLTVQEEPVEREFQTQPLPSEFWLRPIEGQNTPWWQVASNWLRGPHDYDNGGSGNQYQPDGTGPRSGHILWTKQTEDGGLVGGANFSTPGEVFNAGHQYQTRFTRPIIMWGRLYYEVPIVFQGTGGGWMCVDLKTGEDYWDGPKDFGSSVVEFNFGGNIYRFYSAIGPEFGYYYDWDTRNDHGVMTPGWLFTSNYAQSIHPRYGIVGQLNLTDVPSGYEAIGPKGEHYRYVFDNAGSRFSPDYYLVEWNSSQVFTSNTGEINASIYRSNNIDWNVSASWMNDMSSVSTRAVQFNDILLGTNGSHPTGTSALQYEYPSPVTFWAVNLDPDSTQYDVGELMWMKNIDTVPDPADGSEWLLIRAAEGVFVMGHMPMRQWAGYSMYTGDKLWETDAAGEAAFNPFGYYSYPSLINTESSAIADGKFFTGGYTGAIHCYDLNNGSLLWRYEAPTYQPIFEYYTLMVGPIVDGMIYIGTHEHSADTPLFKGSKTRCLDIETGEPIWEMTGWAHPYTLAVADGCLVYWNNYDHQAYSVGKGPSSTTVAASPKVSVNGDSILVEGTVMDVSAGTTQPEQAARFPNGVPAVSDMSMSDWMAYVYMQKPRPTDTVGVNVTISVLDPNNNCYDIGTVTGDANGFYSGTFTPEVPGLYTVFTTFQGSESYWPSSAVTAINVEEAPAATPEPTPMPASMTDTYVLGIGAAAIIAIVVVGLVIILMLRRR